jgi:hypothetical protein
MPKSLPNVESRKNSRRHRTRRRLGVALAVLAMIASTMIAPLVATAGAGTQSGSFGALPYGDPIQSRCQGVHVGSHVTEAGKIITATTSAGICGPTGPGNHWTWTVSGISGCKANDTSCTFRAAETDGTYVNVCISGANVQGGWTSCDYYGTPAKGKGVVDGYVKDKSGDPVVGVDVTAYGPHGGGSTTGPDGWYAIQLASGAYHVQPSGGPQGKAPPTYVPKYNDTTVGDGTTGTADFTLQSEIELSLKFTKSSVPADGLSVVNGTITTTQYGKPLPNVNVQLEAMPSETRDASVTTAPKASLCSNGGRIWPTGTMSSPDGIDVTINTGATGTYPFSVTVGTTPGTWSLDAWAYNSNGRLSSDTPAASQTESIRFTPTGSTPLIDFVNELNITEKASTSLQTAGASASSLVNALAQAAGAGGKLAGLAYSLVNAPDGQSMLVFPAKDPPIVDRSGVVTVAQGTNGDDLVFDPARWSPLGGNALGLADALTTGSIYGLPTVKEFAAGTSVTGWNGTAGSAITPFSTGSFEYLGYGYPGIAEPGACY